MHIFCQGEGEPTVLFEAGAGNFSLHWSLVQEKVARITRACVYDRAGYGWSDRSSNERTPMEMAKELHQLLENGDNKGPYVLVGHSLGGLIARIYTHLYPDRVVGMVLVDATHEAAPLRSPEALTEVDAQFRKQLQQRMRWLILKNILGLQALFPQSISAPSQFPEEAKNMYRALLASKSGFYMTYPEELEGLENSFSPIRGMNLNSVDDLPLVVLIAGKSMTPDPSLGLNTEIIQQQKRAWYAMQEDLVHLSSQGQLLVAKNSSHMIPLEQPDLIIQAIYEVVSLIPGK